MDRFPRMTRIALAVPFALDLPDVINFALVLAAPPRGSPAGGSGRERPAD
jgi:hypothetical protein